MNTNNRHRKSKQLTILNPPQWLRRRIARSAIAALSVAASFQGLMAQSPPERRVQVDDRVYWSRLDFVIPFNVDQTGQTPREIQLEYSVDGGSSWSLYSRSDVRSKQFQFQAQSDGEYQFRLKTLDAQGRSFDNPGEPLRVFVDTTKPTANLNIDMDQRGIMLAEFEINDVAFDPASVKLTYQTESMTQPREIEFDLSAGSEQGVWIGTGSWSLPNGSRQLSVRLTGKDKAGNSVDETRLPQLPRSAAANNNLQLASGKPRDSRSIMNPVMIPDVGNGPVGSGLAAKSNEPMPKIQILTGPGSRPPTNVDSKVSTHMVERQLQLIEHQEKLIQQQLLASQQLAASSQFGTGLNGIRTTETIAQSRTQRKNPDSATLVGQGIPIPQENDSALRQELKSSKLPIREMTDEEYEQAVAPKNISLVAKRSDKSLVVQETNDSSQKQLGSGIQLEPTINRIEGQSTFRNNIKPLYSCSKTFSLDYTIENEPDSPVSSVELWGTTDEGQTWQMWGQDPDRASPFDIQVETEGLFGFRMIIVGANGLASNRPRNGDNADSWILVDVNKPQAKLISALYGKGQEAGKMIIEYKAMDDHFSDRPITLSYSETPDGPWKTIATGLRNNERYLWPADPSLPTTLYLRLEAHDSAGNVGVHVLDHPINVEGLAPRGRIQGFRPIQ